MQTRKPALLLRMYGSMDAARAALAEEAQKREQRAKALQAAQEYVRGGSSISTFGRRSTQRGDV